MRTSVAVPALGALLAVGLAACGGSDATVDPGTTPPVTQTPTPRVPDCASIYAGVNAGVLPEGSLLESATVCGEGAQAVPTIVTVTRAEDAASLDALAELLPRPDAPADDHVVCTQELRIAPDLVVVPVGEPPLAPHIPLDVCGKPELEVVRILDSVVSGA